MPALLMGVERSVRWASPGAPLGFLHLTWGKEDMSLRTLVFSSAERGPDAYLTGSSE